jgi:hypothetical protein
MGTFGEQVLEGYLEHWTGLYNVMTFDVDVVWSSDLTGCKIEGKPRINVDYGGLPFWRADLECEDPVVVRERSDQCDGPMECNVIHCQLTLTLVRYVRIQEFKESFSVKVCPDGRCRVMD